MSFIAARLVRAGRASRKRGAVATGAALALAFGSGVAVARPARAVKRRPRSVSTSPATRSFAAARFASSGHRA